MKGDLVNEKDNEKIRELNELKKQLNFLMEQNKNLKEISDPIGDDDGFMDEYDKEEEIVADDKDFENATIKSFKTCGIQKKKEINIEKEKDNKSDDNMENKSKEDENTSKKENIIELNEEIDEIYNIRKMLCENDKNKDQFKKYAWNMIRDNINIEVNVFQN